MARAEDNVVDIPHDLVNEQIMIAAVLVDEKLRGRLTVSISPDLFVDGDHGLIWSAIRKMKSKGVEFSIPTLHSMLEGRVKVEYLHGLVRSYPKPPVTIEHHIENLKWDHVRAQAIQGPLGDLIRELRNPSTAPTKIRALAKKATKAFDVRTDRQFMMNPSRLADEHLIALKRRQSMGVYPFGLGEFDTDSDTGNHRVVPGAAPGKTTLVTGVSGSGKSTMAALIALEQARSGRKVLYGAWEMGPGPTIELLAQISLYQQGHTQFTRYRVATGELEDDDLETLRDRMEVIGEHVRFFNAPFGADPSKRYGNDEALDVIHQQMADSACDVVIFDLWERMIPDGRPDHERRALTRQQQIAIETDMHQILVCQQRLKEVEKQRDKRPTRDSILGSSAWVDIADTIIGVNRPRNWDTHAPETIELLCLKQRFGPWPWIIEFDYDPDSVTISKGREIEYEHPSAASRDPLEGLGRR